VRLARKEWPKANNESSGEGAFQLNHLTREALVDRLELIHLIAASENSGPN